MKAVLALLFVLLAATAAAEPTEDGIDDTFTAVEEIVDSAVGAVDGTVAEVQESAAPQESGLGKAASALGAFFAAVGDGVALAAVQATTAIAAAGIWGSATLADGLAALAAPLPDAFASIGGAARSVLLATGALVADAAAFVAAQVTALAGLYASLVGSLRPRALPAPAFAAIVATGTAATAAAATYGATSLVKRFGWLLGLPAMAGFSRIEDSELLKHPVRAQLFQVIQANPGIHASALGRSLEAGWGTIVHHLDKLEKAKLVAVRKVNNQKCYFEAGGKVSRQDMQVASAVRGDSASQIAAFVDAHPMTSQKAMAAELGISPALTSFHVKKLVALGVLDKVRQGKQTLLTTTESLRRVTALETARPVPVLAAVPAIKA